MAEQEIQTYPGGLVDLLNIKQSSGKAVDKLSDLVVPHIELNDIFAASQIIHTSATSVAINAPGNGVLLTVPNNEVWFLYSAVAILHPQDIGDRVGCNVEIQQQNIGIAVGIGETITAVATTDRSRAVVNYARPLILGAGQTVAAVVSSLLLTVAPSTQLDIRIRVARVGPESKITTL